MDRLVCADVGFGKTEVAIRAVFKCVQDAKQAAVLVPTTLLASQHFQTFSDRFAGYPVRVEMLSRFLTDAEARARRRRRRRRHRSTSSSGRTGCSPSTSRSRTSGSRRRRGAALRRHAQRGGEAASRPGVDVLTLTASPIPRTLEMALTGIRDLSMIQTPPADRQPILTYVGEFDERAVTEALRRELLREGQAFFVHNRVRDIEDVARRVRELVPEARVVVAHGQMDEGTLERVVYDFWERRSDVLVCTTIIESGIDMPTVNTLVVDRADLLGLGQLHQLRGRVGPQRPPRVRVPVPPAGPGALRAGLRAAADDRRAHRARERLQDRDARPRDPRRGQPPRPRPVRPRGRGRLRPVRPARRRGDRRGDGRRAPRAADGLARRARRRAPARDAT